jgi:hypothetical protein
MIMLSPITPNFDNTPTSHEDDYPFMTVFNEPYPTIGEYYGLLFQANSLGLFAPESGEPLPALVSFAPDVATGSYEPNPEADGFLGIWKRDQTGAVYFDDHRMLVDDGCILGEFDEVALKPLPAHVTPPPPPSPRLVELPSDLP